MPGSPPVNSSRVEHPDETLAQRRGQLELTLQPREMAAQDRLGLLPVQCRRDLLEPQPELAQRDYPGQPGQVVVAVQAVTGTGAQRGAHERDGVVVTQRPDRQARGARDLADAAVRLVHGPGHGGPSRSARVKRDGALPLPPAPPVWRPRRGASARPGRRAWGSDARRAGA